MAEGRAFLTLDQPQRALANFRIATVIMQALLAEDDSKISWQRDLAQSHTLAGNALMASGNVRDADQTIASSMSMLEILLSAHPDDRGALRLLAEAYLLNGRIRESANEVDEANYVWQQAMVTLEKLSTDTNDYRILGIQAQVLLHLDLEKEANPIIERLTAMGYAEPAYVDLCSRRGLSARLAQ